MKGPVIMTSRDQEPDLLETLVEARVIEEASARRARQVALSTGESIVAVLHQLALADDGAVAAALARCFGMAAADAAEIPARALVLPGLSPGFLRRKRVLPLADAEGGLLVGVVDPHDHEGPNAVAFAAGRPAQLRIMAFSHWRKAFETLYGADDGDTPGETADADASPDAVWADDTARVRDQSESAPAVRLVDRILEQATEAGASDIHIEPLPDRVRVRFRVDGELRTVTEEAAHLAAPIAARIKILADMDVANRRTPQDGRTSLAAKGRPIDVRISTVPSTHGETVALRLLRREADLLDIRTLGFSPSLVELLEHVLNLRRGLFLVTGPTGSGKTTTLYAMLQRLRGAPLKILSIEDPIEYFFPEITQTQVNEEAGLTFATALRSFLRQDPDVILVGEIRDAETARIAIQAALTGHLVLATLHTSDAVGAVSRLVDMGVDRYLVAATLTAVVAQRLARRLCERCRQARAPSAGETTMLRDQGASEATTVSDAVGCSACRSGHRGRLAIGEGFRITDTVREAIADPSGLAIADALRAAGFEPLFKSAARLAAAGEISLTELRVLMLA